MLPIFVTRAHSPRDMEVNDQLHFACRMSTAAASVLKSSSYQEDSLHTNGITMSSAQLGRAMNGELNINGVTLDSEASTSEAFAPTAPSLEVRDSHPNSMSGYDFFWDCGQYQSTSVEKLKEKVMLSQLSSQGQHQSNGPFEAAIKDVPIEPSTMPKNLKLCDDRTHNSTGLDFDPYGLCSPQKIHFDMVQETSSFSPNHELTRTMSEEVPSFTYPYDHQYEHCNSQPDIVDLEDADLDLFCSKDYEEVVEMQDKESESRRSSDNDINGCIESKMEELKMPSNQDISTHPFFDYDGDHSLENSITFNIPLKEFPHDAASVVVVPYTSSYFMELTGESDNEMNDCHDAEVKMSLKQDVSALSLSDSTLAPSLESLNLFKSSLNETQTSASLLMTPRTSSPRKDLSVSDSETDECEDPDAAAVKILSKLVMSTLTLSDGDSEGPAAPDAGCTRSLDSSTLFKTPVKKAKKQVPVPVTPPTPSSSATSKGECIRRRVTDERELRIPLQYGWKREIRIRTVGSRLHGETTYYAPCGKRLRQFPEVIKYLVRNAVTEVSREHFSFSPRMNVGEFFEARESSEDGQWCKLNADEIPLRIKAMMGRLGRPPNPNKQRAPKQPKVKRGKGRPPKVKTVTLLNNTDAKLMKKLETQAVLNEKEKQKLKALMNKLKQKGQTKLKPGPKVQQAQRVKKNPKEKHVKRQQRLRQKQQRLQLLQEMRKPTEDLYLTDHKPLPEFVPIPGLVLSGRAFSDCLTVIEFLHNYGKVLGFDTSKDVPTLNTLQEGLLNVGDNMGEIQDLLIRLLHIAVVDPGLPHKYQSVTFLGERICDIGINRENVSEVLRIFLEAYGAETELCEGLKSKSFQAHCCERKAAVLAFLVNELLGSSVVIREIDKNIDHRANIRKNKWIVEGKLRRLKRALAKKKGIREPDGIVEGRRRKQGLGAEEDHNSADPGNGDEESAKEETKEKSSERRTEGINKADDHPSASVAELNRQIEKLSKRQSFFARKLLQVSQTLRALLLGQDRFRRRYWVFPHLSGVFVEGSEGSLGTEELDAEKNQLKPIETTPVKVEPRDVPNTPGRPKDSRRRKCEAELVNPENPKRHCAAANAKHCSGTAQDAHSTNQTHHNVDQSAVFLAWLSLLQNSVPNLPLPTPQCSTSKDSPSAISPEMLLASNRKLFDLSVPNSEQKVKDCAEKHGQWFSLLPRMPCDSSSLTQLPFSSQQTLLNQYQRLDSDPNQLSRSPLKLPPSAAFATSQFMPFMDIPFAAQSVGSLNAAATYGTSIAASLRAGPTAAIGKVKSHQSGSPPQNESPLPRIPRRRGRPSKLLKEVNNQRQLKPIPAEMQRGWWCIDSLEELHFLLKALHPRGVREKALHKQILKHMDYVSQACTREKTDSIFSNNKEQSVTKEMVEKWKPEKWAFPVDLEALRYLEVLEQRVISASLQVKGWTSPDTDSTRDDLVYFDQQWLMLGNGTVKDEEKLELMRRNNNPLDLAVTRLAMLELNVERRYLKEPLWIPVPGKLESAGTVSSTPAECVNDAEQYSNEGHISPGLCVWRETLLKCTNAAQVFMCIQQLERAIAWEKSVMKVSCQICRKGDKDELLLLCDNCDQGCHTYCLKPKIVEIPEGDWFCPICIAEASGRSVRSGALHRQSKQRRDGRRSANKVSGTESFVHHCPRKYMKKQRRKCLSRGGTPAAKRKKMSTRNQSSDLTLCEVILMEMESHEDAWPFLHPVNPRLVPGYRKIIKKPMDFATIRGKLISGKYLSCKEFATDTTLVFDNCVTFNEDDSEVGRAGYVMRKFFESRWAEFYHSS
uniref:bromodomain adjacent to zinc finger domain protein 2A-like isoform X2 n=1 Tax=Pristiophorus japonicus TaxID=55135 RepID=UPI00398F88FF